VLWQVHTDDVVRGTEGIMGNLQLDDALKRAIVFAAVFHDLGKQRKRFQTTLGNFGFPNKLWAKSGKHSGGRIRDDYRHEFGSLFDLRKEKSFTDLIPELKELVMHLVAVHHGYGRPHFPADRAFDPDATAAECEALASELPRRFAKLQRKYGRWGLAYLESLLRAADYAASANPSAFEKEESQ